MRLRSGANGLRLADGEDGLGNAAVGGSVRTGSAGEIAALVIPEAARAIEPTFTPVSQGWRRI